MTTKDIQSKIKKDTVLFFDLDGTLINTDYANFLSYESAVQSVLSTSKGINYKPDERFNRTVLKKYFPSLSQKDVEQIIRKKEAEFEKHLPKTNLNEVIVDVLIQYSKTNQTVLVTNCREERAIITLKFHNIYDKFDYKFFRQFTEDGKKINKYKNALMTMRLPAQKVVVFENEKSEINDAILAGISLHNIIKA